MRSISADRGRVPRSLARLASLLPRVSARASSASPGIGQRVVFSSQPNGTKWEAGKLDTFQEMRVQI